MNKTEYLEWLREWDASESFERWVEDRTEDSARDILLACDSVDWLVWAVGRMSPTKAVEFAKRCADRAAVYSAANSAAAVAAWVASEAASEAASASAYWYKSAAAAEAAAAANLVAAASYWSKSAAASADVAAYWSRSEEVVMAEHRTQLEDLHALVKEVF